MHGGAESTQSNNGIGANGGGIHQAQPLRPMVSCLQFLFACPSCSFIRPEHPFFPELLAEIEHRGPRATIQALWGGNMGHIVSATEAFATEEALATEAMAMEALAIEALVMEALTTEAPVTFSLAK